MTTSAQPQPSLPVELIELLLLHLPAVLLTRPRRTSTEPPARESPSDEQFPEPNSRLTLAQWTRWALCILPPSFGGLPTSALVKSVAKDARGGNPGDWTQLFDPANKASPQSIFSFLTNWYTKWTDSNDAHMFAAFDCALIANRVDVLSLWWVQPLPVRTGFEPQRWLPLSEAVAKGAFDAVEYLYVHLTKVQRGPWSESEMRKVFDYQLGSSDMIPLWRGRAADSRESRFAFDWIEKYGVSIDCYGDLLMFASKEGRIDVLEAIANWVKGGTQALVKEMEPSDRFEITEEIIKNEQWDVLKWWVSRSNSEYCFTMVTHDD